MCGRTLDIKVRIRDKEGDRRGLQYSLFLTNNENDSDPMSFRDIDNQWHFLFFRIINPTFSKPTFDIYLDTFEKDTRNTLSVQVKGVDFEAENYVALGNSTDLLLRHLKETKDFAAMETEQEETKKQTKEDKKDKKNIKFVSAKDYIRFEDKVSVNFEINNLEYFRGQVSFPFFLSKVGDF